MPIADASDMHAAQARLIAPSVAHRLAGVFKSLSDPTRLRIISMVSEREFCVTDLAAALEMEQSTISHQLRDMRRLGLPARVAVPLQLLTGAHFIPPAATFLRP